MGSGKVNLSLIEDDVTRISTMKNGCQELMKKVDELSTLCGTPAVCLVYNPSEPEPTVWPSHDEVQEQLNHYFSISEAERNKNAMTLESYLEARIAKKRDQYTKLVKMTNKLEEAVLMDEVFYGKGLDGLDSHELDRLALLMKEKVDELRKKRDLYEGDRTQQQ